MSPNSTPDLQSCLLGLFYRTEREKWTTRKTGEGKLAPTALQVELRWTDLLGPHTLGAARSEGIGGVHGVPPLEQGQRIRDKGRNVLT